MKTKVNDHKPTVHKWGRQNQQTALLPIIKYNLHCMKSIMKTIKNLIKQCVNACEHVFSFFCFVVRIYDKVKLVNGLSSPVKLKTFFLGSMLTHILQRFCSLSISEQFLNRLKKTGSGILLPIAHFKQYFFRICLQGNTLIRYLDNDYVYTILEF